MSSKESAAGRRIDLMATLRDTSEEEIRLITCESFPESETSPPPACLQVVVKNSDDQRPDPEEIAVMRLLKDLKLPSSKNKKKKPPEIC